MPINKKYLAEFCNNKFYHIYNRTNNRELLFREEKNYHFFLKQFARYLSELVEIHAWALLPNHFHFLIKVKDAAQIRQFILKKDPVVRTHAEQLFLDTDNTDLLTISAFKRFFTSYAMAFNKVYHRKGNLFARTFKRKEIHNNDQYNKTLLYIHLNPLKHKLINDFKDYEWTSYNRILYKSPGFLQKKEVLRSFGNRKIFMADHYLTARYFFNASAEKNNQ